VAKKLDAAVAELRVLTAQARELGVQEIFLGPVASLGRTVRLLRREADDCPEVQRPLLRATRALRRACRSLEAWITRVRVTPSP
jgi:hypothetical protein